MRSLVCFTLQTFAFACVQALVFAAGKAMQAAGARPPPVFSPVTSAAARAVSHMQVRSMTHGPSLWPARARTLLGLAAVAKFCEAHPTQLLTPHASLAGCKPLREQASDGGGGAAVPSRGPARG